ncbi:helix-turn-helix domain-containing protein [Clostridium perfringens]|uniref:helix-turn-helix domain-containing protein n=1 Tax=Clostridium perfringens TaxID=1502 RepID=UPI003F428460
MIDEKCNEKQITLEEFQIFGENIKRFRKANKLTQEKLAEMLGISRSTLSYYEHGSIEPNITTIMNISKIMNCSIDELMGFKLKDNNNLLKLNEIKLNAEIEVNKEDYIKKEKIFNKSISKNRRTFNELEMAKKRADHMYNELEMAKKRAERMYNEFEMSKKQVDRIIKLFEKSQKRNNKMYNELEMAKKRNDRMFNELKRTMNREISINKL